MKKLNPDVKQKILETEGVLYLYNSLEEKAVKIVLNGEEWKAIVKSPCGIEREANYDKSKICGDAFVYGEVMTEEEYNRFPEGVELSELSKEEIQEFEKLKKQDNEGK